jgi:hypothetical protein
MQFTRHFRRLGGAALATFALAACGESDNPTPVGNDDGSVASAVAAPGSISPWAPVPGDVYACKSNFERGQPAGLTGTFSVTAPAGSSLFLLTGFTIPTLADTQFPDGSTEVTVTCRKVFRIAEGVQGPVQVTVTETAMPGSLVARVFTYDNSNTPTGPASFTSVQDFMPNPVTTASATVSVSPTLGAVVWFKNTVGERPPVRLQGCTPGYWRQEQHFDNWTSPYTPDTPFSTVFEDAFPGQTLGQVVQLGGGGLNALGRHAVAALLNAASSGVSYAYQTPADVINAFNAAFPGSDFQYEALKNEFERENERGCPLN